jgi:hypothetical protein
MIEGNALDFGKWQAYNLTKQLILGAKNVQKNYNFVGINCLNGFNGNRWRALCS